MTMPLKHLDCDGYALSAGDVVLLVKVPDSLLSGLPVEDQDAIRSQIGKVLKVDAFDNYGNAEVEFVDNNGDLHTIWVNSTYLKKKA